MVAGPTNLFAILNCLNVGFRTAAVEQRAEEIHRLLGAVRREFQMLGHVVERSKRQAQTVVNGIEEVETRFRVMDRTLKSADSTATTTANGDRSVGGEDKSGEPLLFGERH
jgi:DNA recombination protein RmuC